MDERNVVNAYAINAWASNIVSNADADKWYSVLRNHIARHAPLVPAYLHQGSLCAQVPAAAALYESAYDVTIVPWMRESLKEGRGLHFVILPADYAQELHDVAQWVGKHYKFRMSYPEALAAFRAENELLERRYARDPNKGTTFMGTFDGFSVHRLDTNMSRLIEGQMGRHCMRQWNGDAYSKVFYSLRLDNKVMATFDTHEAPYTTLRFAQPPNIGHRTTKPFTLELKLAIQSFCYSIGCDIGNALHPVGLSPTFMDRAAAYARATAGRNAYRRLVKRWGPTYTRETVRHILARGGGKQGAWPALLWDMSGLDLMMAPGRGWQMSELFAQRVGRGLRLPPTIHYTVEYGNTGLGRYFRSIDNKKLSQKRLELKERKKAKQGNKPDKVRAEATWKKERKQIPSGNGSGLKPNPLLVKLVNRTS